MIAPPLRTSAILPNCGVLDPLLEALSSVRPRVRVTSRAFQRPGSFLITYLPSGPFSLSSMTSCSILSPLTSVMLLIVMPSNSSPNEWPTPLSPSVMPSAVSDCSLSFADRCVVDRLRCYSLTRLVPPENWASRKITNSAGLTGATPISQTTWPASMPSAGLVSASHLT